MSDKVLKTLFLPRDELFYEAIEILSDETRIGTLNTPQFTVGETDLSYRVINHWGKHNILPDAAKKEKGWHKFTLTEMVWLKIASRLRDFGFSLKMIAQIKKQIMWSKGKNENHIYPFLDFYIARAWTQDEESYVIVFSDGDADMGSALEIDLEKDKLLPNKKDMLLISLKGILNELGVNNVKDSKLRLPVNKEILQVLKALRSSVGNQNEVNIKIQKGKVAEIETAETIPENIDFKKINEAFKNTGGFGEVVTQFSNGTARSVRVKKRQRF